jgi:hypothetical protein
MNSRLLWSHRREASLVSRDHASEVEIARGIGIRAVGRLPGILAR